MRVLRESLIRFVRRDHTYREVMPLKRLIRLLLFVVLFLGLASAQTAVVTRNVNLRPDASTDNDPIEKLTPGAELQLLEPGQTDGFFHVKAADGNSGFVWARDIPLEPANACAPPS